MLRREAEFAGSHYPAEEQEFTRVMEHLLIDHWNPYQQKVRVQACLLPDDSLLFSGECAVKTLARIEVPDRVLLIHGRRNSVLGGVRLAAFDRWETPFGDVQNDNALFAAISTCDPRISMCEACEEGESSVEALLPILSFFNPDMQICVMSVGHSVDDALVVANALATALRAQDEGDILICAATTTHADESHVDVSLRDEELLEALESLDANAVAAFEGQALSGASVLALVTKVCAELGCGEFAVIDQRDSSEATGDVDQVEGYIGGYFR